MSAIDPLREPTRVAFAGDWHANGRWASAAIRYAAEAGAEAIVHLGDFGYAFSSRFLRGCEHELRQAGLVLLFVDGNHEDFDRLHAFPVQENGLRRLTDRVWHLPRGTRWSWGGLRWLALGGAHSVDRPWRVPGVSWWPQETLTAAQAQQAVDGGPTDVLVAHDCPAGVDLPGLGAGAHWLPAEELQAADRHRGLLRQVVDEVRPRTIWHGHYHDHAHDSRVDLGFGPVRVVGLDCDESSLAANVRVVDVAELAG